MINTDLWAKAGLTDADIPKDWAGLEAVAKKLTKGKVTGLVIGNDINRGGAFMVQAGGWVVNKDGSKVTADTPQNLAGLTEIKKMMAATASLKYMTDTNPAAGWGGEALGKGAAAMTIEGNWIRGALTKDFPNIKTKVVELPAGPAGKGTLLFSNCWGIAAKSAHQGQAVDLVKSLTSVDQQMAFAKAFGVMPSTEEGAKKFAADLPRRRRVRGRWRLRPGPGQPARLRPGDGGVQLQDGDAQQGRRPEGDARRAPEERRRGPQGQLTRPPAAGGTRMRCAPCATRLERTTWHADEVASTAARASRGGSSPHR